MFLFNGFFYFIYLFIFFNGFFLFSIFYFLLFNGNSHHTVERKWRAVVATQGSVPAAAPPSVGQLTVGRSGDCQTRQTPETRTVTRTPAPPGRGRSLCPPLPEPLTRTGFLTPPAVSWRPDHWPKQTELVAPRGGPSNSAPPIGPTPRPVSWSILPRACVTPSRPPAPAAPADRHGSAGARHAGPGRVRLHPVLRAVADALHVHHLCVSPLLG